MQYTSGPEHRDAREVFAAASLATLNGVRVTIGHTDMTQVGYVLAGSHDRVSGADGQDYLRALLVITDAATVERIRSGELKHISCGYSCRHVVRDGRTWQTQISFDHVALLRRNIETPRCGEHCSLTQDQTDMTQRVTDAIQFDGTAACACASADAAERDRIAAMLDHATHVTGVHRDAIIGEMIRVHGHSAEITRDLIHDAAARVARPGSYLPPSSAVHAAWHNPGQRPAPRADAAKDDDAFRALLASKLRADADTEDASDVRGDATDDEAFRASLARLARDAA